MKLDYAMPKSVILKMDNRPLAAVCQCGKILRGSTREISADRIYAINKKKYCERCALAWFDENYLISELL